jgi:hypothetical protein
VEAKNEVRPSLQVLFGSDWTVLADSNELKGMVELVLNVPVGMVKLLSRARLWNEVRMYVGESWLRRYLFGEMLCCPVIINMVLSDRSNMN